jgi:hypothetical protein
LPALQPHFTESEKRRRSGHSIITAGLGDKFQDRIAVGYTDAAELKPNPCLLLVNPPTDVSVLDSLEPDLSLLRVGLKNERASGTGFGIA